MGNNNERRHGAIAVIAEYERIAALPVQARYAIATLGSLTERGGTVRTATSVVCIGAIRAARVGDEVHYSDGSIAYITSGTGAAALDNDRPMAIVGSHISNGDVISESQQSAVEIVVREGMPPIPGFLDPGYVALDPAGGRASRMSHGHDDVRTECCTLQSKRGSATTEQ